MKKIVFLSILLLTIGFSQDLFELGLEAYNKGDYSKAAELSEKACTNGKAIACFGTGLLYEIGQGVEQDYHKAAELYKKACDGGYAQGCYKIGFLYANGQGVEQDYHKAAELY